MFPDRRCRRCASGATDIPLLVEHFAAKAARELGREPRRYRAGVHRAGRLRYDWPGNIRELENVIECALIMSGGALLDGRDVFSASKERPVAVEGTLESMERAYIVRVLESAGWQIEGERGAARILGLNPSTLRGRMRKLDISKPN